MAHLAVLAGHHRALGNRKVSGLELRAAQQPLNRAFKEVRYLASLIPEHLRTEEAEALQPPELTSSPQEQTDQTKNNYELRARARVSVRGRCLRGGVLRTPTDAQTEHISRMEARWSNNR